MRFFLVFCCVLWAACAAAQTDPRLNALLSKDFAVTAFSHWQKGDRPSAIIAALRGIPAAASADDDTLYAKAFDALALAVVSRSVQLPLEKPTSAGFSPDGTRLVTVATFPQGETVPADGVRLWDPQSGALIAELIPHEQALGAPLGTVTTEFSPDGRLLAVGLPKTGQVHIFEAATGARVTVLGRVMQGGVGSYPFARFTGDGAALVVNSYLPQEIAVYRTSDWAKIAERAIGECYFMYPIGRGEGAAPVYFAINNVSRTNQFNSACAASTVSAAVHRFGADGSETVVFTAPADFVPALGASGAVSPDGRHALLPSADFGTLVANLETGAVVAATSPQVMQSYAVQFARSGDYLVNTEKFLSEFELEGRAFDGTPREAMIEDALPYAHMVHAANGTWMGVLSSETGQRGFMGDALPKGRGLYDYVWDQLPEAVREMVNADRVGG